LEAGLTVLLLGRRNYPRFTVPTKGLPPPWLTLFPAIFHRGYLQVHFQLEGMVLMAC
jgi:hypothetical protein